MDLQHGVGNRVILTGHKSHVLANDGLLGGGVAQHETVHRQPGEQVAELQTAGAMAAW